MRSDARANRDRLLAAAEEVFGEAGAGAATDEIARRAGVGIGTLFRHFPTKQDLIEATLLRHLGLLVDEAHRLADDAPPGEALSTMIRTMVSGAPAKVALFGLLSAEGGMTAAAIRASGELRAAVADLLVRAQQAGMARADASVDEVYLLLRGLSQATTIAGADPDTLDRAVRIILDGLAAPAAR
ncbi:TetR/AcrR family transcriptional regulator [Micromonospora sp. IBHARD004]|uniref:TetR/AcrR family transcriptional regulator n=1 Tax=Micromonospora sp. IBHARD004 TaxID=3457764 RepID=UPI004058A10C